jgi:hypothetical protein
MEMSGLLHASVPLFQGRRKRSWCPMNRRLDWPLRRFGRGGEEKVPCHLQQSNHGTAQYVHYKLHIDLQSLRNFIYLRGQHCDYHVQVMTPCSLVEELFLQEMDKQVFPKHPPK